jgi:polyisoprenoid-binding protein YceI
MRSLVVAVLLLVCAGSAHAAEWKMDPAASRLTLQASYQNEPVPGTFKQFDTRLRFDPARLVNSKLDVVVKLDSMDMGSSEINDGVKDPDWLDPNRFPEARFESSDIRQTAPGRFLANGTLTLKGKKQPVAVPFTWESAGKTATMAGELTVKRTAFGVGAGEWTAGDLIGLDVKVMFNVRLQQVN